MCVWIEITEMRIHPKSSPPKCTPLRKWKMKNILRSQWEISNFVQEQSSWLSSISYTKRKNNKHSNKTSHDELVEFSSSISVFSSERFGYFNCSLYYEFFYGSFKYLAIKFPNSIKLSALRMKSAYIILELLLSPKNCYMQILLFESHNPWKNIYCSSQVPEIRFQ